MLVVVPTDAVKAAASTRRVPGSEARGRTSDGDEILSRTILQRAALRLWFLRRLLCRCSFHSSSDDADVSRPFQRRRRNNPLLGQPSRSVLPIAISFTPRFRRCIAKVRILACVNSIFAKRSVLNQSFIISLGCKHNFNTAT